MATITMSYGAYGFSPVPLMSLNKEYQRTQDQTIVGALLVVTLHGTLTPLPNDLGGIDNTAQLMQELRSAFNGDGRFFKVQCNSTVIFSGCPRIRNIQFEESNNNWVYTIPYTIELEFDEDKVANEDNLLHPPYIEEATDEWTIEFVEEHKAYSIDLNTVTDQQGGYYYDIDRNSQYMMRLTHNLSAKGKRHYTCSSGASSGGSLDMEAWEQARNYVVGRLGIDWNRMQSSGVINLPTGDSHAYDHFRTNQVGELAGTFSVTETWLILGEISGANGNDRATEDFTATIRQSLDNNLTIVSIEGSIQGLESRNYDSGYTVSEYAYDAATNYWSFIQPRIFSRAQYVGQSETSRNFNPIPLSKSVGHNPSRGIINYSYEFNDRPCNFISGSLSENISIVENHPTDVFAKIPVLGRAKGPVLQDISTVTEHTKEVTIEVVMPLPLDCSSLSSLDLYKPDAEVTELLCQFETELTSSYDQVFKHIDSEQWSPQQGRYSRSVGWTISNCSGGSDITTSLCE